MGVTAGGHKTAVQSAQSPPISNNGAPTNGVDEVQTITGDGAANPRLTFVNPLRGSSKQTAQLGATATASAIQTALRALSNMPTNGVTCAGGPLGTAPVTVTFGGALSGLPIAAITSDVAGVTVAETTPGVAGTGRGAPRGRGLVDTETGVDYRNTGTAEKPVWTKTGTQS